MKKCKWCQTEIEDKCKVCPQCGKDLRNWFAKHPVWSVIIGLIVIGMVANAGKTTPTSTSVANAPVVQEQSKPSEPEITKEVYDTIKTGMTIEQVKAILGEPKSVSENEIAGLGKTEMYHYQKGFSTTAIDVFFTNGKVSSKNWVKL